MTPPTTLGSNLTERFDDYLAYLAQGDTCGAMEHFYAPDVIIFDNRLLARAGREACITFEKAQLERLSQPPSLQLLAWAANTHQDRSFVELTVRFTDHDGHNFRIDQVAVQHWHRGFIVEEHFYYEGIIDESDEELPATLRDELPTTP